MFSLLRPVLACCGRPPLRGGLAGSLLFVLVASAFTTRLVAEGGATRITSHARFIPDRWIPPAIGLAIPRAETRRQFGELRAEIMRWKIREGPNRQSGIRARSRFAQLRFGNSTTPPPSTESSPS